MTGSINTTLVNKTDYSLLESLAIRDCTTPFCSVKIEQLMKFSGLSKTKVRNALRIFIMMGFVKEGNKDRRNKTYYITEQGEDHFLEVFNYTFEQLDKLRDDYDKSLALAQTECSISVDTHDESNNTEDVNNDDNNNNN